VKRYSKPDPQADAPLFDGPSKSVRKREAQRAQALGEELIALSDVQLRELELPEVLYEAIVAARGISARGGGARQRQYIGKLMRDIDLTRVRGALAARAAAAELDAKRFQRAEQWRTRLISGGAEAFAALRSAYPALDEAQWHKRLEAARREHQRTGAGGGASRELFRALRELLG